MSRVRAIVSVAAAGGVALAAVALRTWHLGWGATGDERHAPLPGDEIPVSSFGMRATRAVDIDAPPEQVWPWIVQIGVGKAGWYSYDLIDNLGRHSSETILPQWQQVAVGDPAAPMNPMQPVDRSPWRVAQVAAPNVLVWHHPKSGTWSWNLQERPDGRTRLVTRLRTSYAYPGGLAFAPILEVADFPMFRKMLLGLKARAERPDS